MCMWMNISMAKYENAVTALSSMPLCKPLIMGPCGKLLGLNMCDPLINIHEEFEYLNQWDGCIIACAAVLYDITMLQQ